MGVCAFVDNILSRIYGDNGKSGCPKFPLFGIAGSLLFVIIGYCLSIVANSGSIAGYWNIVGLVIGVLALLLNCNFLIILFLSESRYRRERKRKQPISDNANNDNGSLTESEAVSEETLNETQDVILEPEVVHNGPTENHTNGSSSSDSFMVIYEDPPNSIASSDLNPGIPMFLQAPAFSMQQLSIDPDSDGISNPVSEANSSTPSR